MSLEMYSNFISHPRGIRPWVGLNQPNMAGIDNAQPLLRVALNAKFPLLNNNICGKLGSGIALAQFSACRGV
jgi:hypothetical protein